jgi:CubicO group peptidase (beta-lactamase class C family)
MTGTCEVQGFVASGLEAVAAEFEHNFAARGELGAAFSAYLDGDLVVDLWGGIADRSSARPWQRDTLQVIFSGTKGIVAACLLILLERHQLDLDAPVAQYWPEFASAGKARVLVRHLVSHTAGLPAVRRRLRVEDVTHGERMSELLAGQKPLLPYGEVVCYHALTFGWLCGELVRRVDGRSIGRFIEDEVTKPLGLELWLGLPAELEERVATLEVDPDLETNPGPAAGVNHRTSLFALVENNPPILAQDPYPWNSRAFHSAEIPGAGSIGTARSIARLYGCLARGGELDGVRLVSEPTIQLGRTQLSRGHDPLGDKPLAFGVGFALQTERHSLGPPADAFGHGGAGGSMHGAWPSQRVGFSYAMNRMQDVEPVDPRADELLKTLYRCITG